MHSDDAVRAHLMQRLSGNRICESAIHQQSSASFYRRKYSGISAAGPYCFSQWPGSKNNALASGYLSRSDGQGNHKLFKRPDLQDLIEEFDDPAIGKESVAGNT